ncbi:hypothetical protein [Rhodococcus pyridinivorans]|uniref:hypothetical protein n=1 Tax=Rhodococcus pyridinivorans TaxID=103816 RepID=UPI002284566B|nr:hypothetical protein [Rhodococcus pyridinivorans]WAL49710.1 hypothetical protein OQN32_27245 [Rhodococcus pyridinivorans]
MARPKVDRLGLAKAGTLGTSLAAFADAPAAPAPESTDITSPNPSTNPLDQQEDDIVDDFDDDYENEDEDDDLSSEEVAEAAPSPRKGRAAARTKRSAHIQMKTFPMLKSTVDAVSDASLNWHISDPSRMKKFGGTASETAFVQALLLFAVDRINRNEKDAQRLLRYFPENARIRNK